MVKSMTGFGRACKEIDGYMITVEIKSLITDILNFLVAVRGSTVSLMIKLNLS